MSDDLENDDFENDGFDEFDDGDSSPETLGQLVQSNPLIKVGVVLGAAALIFGTIILFGGDDEKAQYSSVGAAPQMTVAPGTEDASPAYVEAIQDVNQQSLEAAIAEGTSAIPIPIDPPVGRIPLQEEDVEAEDPLQRWRRLQEERLQRELSSNQVIEPTALPEDNSQQEAVNALAQAMQAQMQQVLERQGKYIVNSQNVTDPHIFEEDDNSELDGEIVDGEITGVNGEPLAEMIIIPAGEIEYGQIITEANSDVPGPVLAEIASGPLSGSRMLGAFTVENDLISLTFSQVVIDGISYPINAIALDPATTLPGMATEVDHRYFRRIILPAAAAFIDGAAEAIAESGRTDITITGDTVTSSETEADDEQEIASGLQEAAEELTTIIDEMNDDVEPLVIIGSGTPMGILFLDPVTKPVEEDDI